jgi:hypothetical protein
MEVFSTVDEGRHLSNPFAGVPCHSIESWLRGIRHVREFEWRETPLAPLCIRSWFLQETVLSNRILWYNRKHLT